MAASPGTASSPDVGARSVLGPIVWGGGVTLLLSALILVGSRNLAHFDAALAWVRYSVESIKFIFASAADEVKVAEVKDTAQKIVEFLTAHNRVTRKQITVDCFGGHVTKTRIDAALDELLSCTPPLITVEQDRSGQGRPTKFYELTANKANYANNQQPSGLAAGLETREQSEVSEQIAQDSELVRQVRKVSEASKLPKIRASIDCSLYSHSSRADSESEVF